MPELGLVSAAVGDYVFILQRDKQSLFEAGHPRDDWRNTLG